MRPRELTQRISHFVEDQSVMNMLQHISNDVGVTRVAISADVNDIGIGVITGVVFQTTTNPVLKNKLLRPGVLEG